MAAFKWYPQARKYEAERKQAATTREITFSHPLKGITVTVTDSKMRKSGKVSRSSSVSSQASSSFIDPLSSSLEGADPLSQFASEATDPLSQLAAQASRDSKLGRTTSPSQACGNDHFDDLFEPWSMKKLSILSKYTTSEKLSITTSFLRADKEKVIVKAQATATVSDKVKNRLEQLDDFEEGSVQEMLNLSQQEYVKRIEELNNALIAAWDQDQRVKALKIAIQCAKLLADVSVIQFYPSKFVLVTDILDTFGRLVFDRIKNKATYLPKGGTATVQLPDNFSPDQVPESAKETCRNWFFKIASIRELIPRFYVEAAILKCYSFLTTGEYSQALRRLGGMCRGVGDPLVALYSRCYLCRVGLLVAPSIRDHLMPAFDDFLDSYNQIQRDSVQNILAVQKLELPRYLTLYSPALDWVLQCVAHKASERVLEQVMERCKRQCNSALLLNSVMSAFKPEYVSSRALQLTDMIKGCEDTGFPKHLLYKSLGVCMVVGDPPEGKKLELLNEVWKVIMKLNSPLDYISCADVWVEYVAKHFSKREVNAILGDVIKHMSPDRAYEDHFPQLQSIVNKLLAHIHDFSLLFSMDKFLPFLDMFQKESIKVAVCKTIMESYIKYQTEPTCDPVITNALMFICKTMHDSVNALTLDDDIRLTGQLINGFIKSIHFGRDFEQQLSFYAESRASFSNIDAVIVFLVQCVNRLAMDTRQIVKGNHTRKTASFVRACVAYNFITIPSLNGLFSRLNLYLASGQVALLNQCLSQADAFFKAAITLVAEVPRLLEVDGKARATDGYLLEYLGNLTSSLLIVPDNPDQGVLYLVRGLLNVIQDHPWDPNSDNLALAFTNILTLLSAMSQDVFLYNMDGVDSNDSLYGHDPKFLKEVSALSATVLEQILDHLKTLDTPATYKRQATLALDLFNKVVFHGNLGQEEMFTLAVRLWALSQKQGLLDTKLMVRTLEYVKRRAAHDRSQRMSQLVSRLPLQSRA